MLAGEARKAAAAACASPVAVLAAAAAAVEAAVVVVAEGRGWLMLPALLTVGSKRGQAFINSALCSSVSWVGLTKFKSRALNRPIHYIFIPGTVV